jgi:hypothetical protein
MSADKQINLVTEEGHKETTLRNKTGQKYTKDYQSFKWLVKWKLSKKNLFSQRRL